MIKKITWLAVAKGLPDDDHPVLTCVASDDDCTAIGFHDGTAWRCSVSAHRLDPQPTHWAELPKSPN